MNPDDNEINRTLQGENFMISIEKLSEGNFEYKLINKTDNFIIIQGDGFESVETVINELSELHEALREIFG